VSLNVTGLEAERSREVTKGAGFAGAMSTAAPIANASRMTVAHGVLRCGVAEPTRYSALGSAAS